MQVIPFDKCLEHNGAIALDVPGCKDQGDFPSLCLLGKLLKQGPPFGCFQLRFIPLPELVPPGSDHGNSLISNSYRIPDTGTGPLEALLWGVWGL